MKTSVDRGVSIVVGIDCMLDGNGRDEDGDNGDCDLDDIDVVAVDDGTSLSSTIELPSQSKVTFLRTLTPSGRVNLDIVIDLIVCPPEDCISKSY